MISQIHSKYKTVVVSEKSTSQYGHENNATNSGIVSMISGTSPLLSTFIGANASGTVDASFLAIPSSQFSPVPGACCLTCALEIDPNIHITYDSVKTYVTFPRASKIWNVAASEPKCDNKEYPATFYLVYDVYYYYLQENDYSDEELFNGLWKMSTPDNIKQYGKHLLSLVGASELKFSTETVSSQGIIFNVIVTDPSYGSSSAYVPVATYACNFEKNECNSLGSTTLLIYSIIFAIIGLIMCFAGFKLLRALVFMSGVAFYWFILYVLFIQFIPQWSTDEILIVSSACSLIGGAFILLVFAFKKFVMISLLNICFTYGMFIAAILFYTPFGYLSAWNTRYQFILGFCCITLLLL